MSAATRPPHMPIPGGAQAAMQFNDLLLAMSVGWVKAPAGHKCGLCSGPIWIKDVGGWERHKCGRCGASRDVRVK